MFEDFFGYKQKRNIGFVLFPLHLLVLKILCLNILFHIQQEEHK